MHRALTIFLAILLAALTAACFGSLPDDAQITAAPTWPPANYRKIIRNSKIPDTLINGAQVSELRKAVAPQSGDWVACLKFDMKPDIGFFAVFIKGQEIIDFRRSVQIDQCEFADYSPLTPLAPPSPTKKTQLKRQKDNTKSIASPGLAPTPDERAICLPDVEKFCAGVTSVEQAFACLQANRSRISTPCNRVLVSHSQ